MPEDKKFKRTPDFKYVYTNNVYFEISKLDLKFYLGITEATGEPVSQHTGVSMTWQEAKLMSYFLQVNIAIYEAAILGDKVRVLKEMWPEKPKAPTPEQEKANPKAREIFDIASKIHSAFIAALEGDYSPQ